MRRSNKKNIGRDAVNASYRPFYSGGLPDPCRLSFDMTQDHMMLIDAIAREVGLARSVMIRIIVHDVLAKHPKWCKGVCQKAVILGGKL